MSNITTTKFGKNEHTPSQILADALSRVQNENFTEVVIVLVNDDRDVFIGNSGGSILRLIGMLETAKHELIAQMDDN